MITRATAIEARQHYIASEQAHVLRYGADEHWDDALASCTAELAALELLPPAATPAEILEALRPWNGDPDEQLLRIGGAQ